MKVVTKSGNIQLIALTSLWMTTIFWGYVFVHSFMNSVQVIALAVGQTNKLRACPETTIYSVIAVVEKECFATSVVIIMISVMGIRAVVQENPVLLMPYIIYRLAWIVLISAKMIMLTFFQEIFLSLFEYLPSVFAWVKSLKMTLDRGYTCLFALGCCMVVLEIYLAILAFKCFFHIIRCNREKFERERCSRHIHSNRVRAQTAIWHYEPYVGEPLTVPMALASSVFWFGDFEPIYV